MSTTNDFGYDDVFELAMQLTPEEMERLIRDLDILIAQNKEQAKLDSDTKQ